MLNKLIDQRLKETIEENNADNVRNESYFYTQHPYLCLASEFKRKGIQSVPSKVFSYKRMQLERIEGTRRDILSYETKDKRDCRSIQNKNQEDD